MCARSVAGRLRDGTFNWEAQKDVPGYSTLPIHDTLVSLISHVARRLDKAPLDKLMELFQDVFAMQLSDLLGDTHLDLKALASLRNVFAHGRDYWLRFDQDEANLLSLDRNRCSCPRSGCWPLRSYQPCSLTHGRILIFNERFFPTPRCSTFLGVHEKSIAS